MKRKRRLAPTGSVRDELTQLGRGARKSLGQHFLASAETAQRIVALAALRGDERVVEIGPGLGALTSILAATARELWLIELDADFAARLREIYARNPNVHVVEADVLRVDFGELLGTGAPAVVVANLPYNVATAILARLIEQQGCFARFIVMVQREVAERLYAKAGTPAYSALSVLTQVEARVEPGLRLGPGAFVPPPKVESEVIIVTPYDSPPVPIDDLAEFKRLVRTVFTQRRKQLGNSLGQICDDPHRVLAQAGVDPQRRPETLDLAEFARLSAAQRLDAG
ncbi:MAG: ribosomal RNA small subunit methyltransferase A [Deltaproteobacteria bacterium]|nr:ribosomal RNA small subunit methyltransferase A [Deltaproteobacteria bacterium]